MQGIIRRCFLFDRIVSLVLLTVLLGAAAGAALGQSSLFTPINSGLPPIQQPHVAWGDYDNDGYPDLAITGFLNGNAVALLFHNNHDGTFTDANAGLQSSNGGKLSWGDFNRDGFLDLLITDSTNRLYLNNGNGTFTPTSMALPWDYWKNEAACGDYNNDGLPDVFGAGAGLFKQNPDGSFTNVPSPIPPLEYASVDWGDFDNDGDLDLLVTGRTLNSQSGENHICKVFRNDGAGGFVQVAAFTGIYLASARWGDYDNDGLLDILVTGGIGDVGQLATIYHNNGDGSFTDINAGLTPVTFSDAAWADFDNDGYLDAIITGQGSNSVSVTALYRNNHDGTFSLVPAGLTNVQNSVVSWADVDRDGDLDLLVAGYATPWNTPVLQLYRNNAVSNSPPTAPAALPVTFLTNGDVLFRWSAATDAQTPSAGLDYNLRIGTSPGGIDMVAPQADPATGLRRLPRFTGIHTNRWPIHGLGKGTYFWAVHAIDAGLAGSPFSVEQSFTITNTPPVIDVAGEVHTGPSAVVSLPFNVTDGESAATQITTTAQSQDNSFIPAASVSIQGNGAQRTLQFTIASSQVGTNYVVLTARDPAGLTTQVSIRVISEFFTTFSFPETTNFYSLTPLRIGWGYPYASPVVDIDHDGDLDVLMTATILSNNYLVTAFCVALNDGRGNFTFNVVSNYALPASDAYWLEDFNHDGNVDLIAGGNGYGSPVQLVPGNGTGAFGTPAALGPGYLSFVADMDGDGALDGLRLNGDLRFYRNVGGLLKTGPGPPLLTLDAGTPNQTTAAVTDLDQNGTLDFFVPVYGTNSSQALGIRTLKNSGLAKFTSDYFPILFAPASLYNSYTFDANDDGLLDYWFNFSTSYTGAIVPGLAANDGTGHFYFTTNGIAPGVIGEDFNNDGLIDRLVSEYLHSDPYTVQYHLFFKTGPNQYAPSPFIISDAGIAADFDGDGDLDYFAYTQEKDQFGFVSSPYQWRFYRNNTDHTNRPPSIPTVLTSTQRNDDRVTLGWHASTDDHTPANLISYNVRLGTTPGGIDIIAPCSEVATGRRLVSRPGNAGTLTFHDVRSLRAGTYYWSVQAIDGVYSASAWAPERSFTINPPSISQLTDVVTPPGLPSKPIPFSVTGGASSVNALTITAVADDPTLIPNAGLVIAGTGAQRTLTITPANRPGDTDLTITATDTAGFSAIVRSHVRVANWDPLNVGFDGSISRYEEWHFVDFDLDGKLDLLGFRPSGTSAPLPFSFHNNGDNTFQLVSNNLPGGPLTPSFVGGFGGDNTPDIMTVQQPAYNSSLLQLFLGNGSNALFNPLSLVSNRSYLYQYKWVDLDNDGWRDIIHFGWIQTSPTNISANGLQIARGKPDGTFEYYPPHIPLYSGSVIAVGDFDLDGRLDLIVCGQDYAANGTDPGTNFMRLYLNQGGGNFTPVTAGLPQTNSWRATVADYDQDGWPDILLSPTTGVTGVPPRLMRNIGGTFVQVSTNFPPQLDQVTWGDFDNDGDLDFVAFTSSDLSMYSDATPYRTTLFRNDGNGVFTPIDTGLPWIVAHQADFADTDNDGDLDLLISGETGWNVTGRFLCINASTKSNTPPPAPSSLSSIRGPTGILTQWTPQPDAESGTALTYNMRLGTTPGGSEIMSAASDPATGRHRIADIGNIGHAPRWWLVLPDGTYYWSVQSIDAAFAASPFASESSFTYYHPTISGLTNVLLYPGQGPAVQGFTVGDQDSAASTLTVSAISSNPTLLPQSGIIFGGAGANRTISVMPAPGLGGTSYVAVVATDITGLSATNTFRVDVNYFTDIQPGFSGSTARWADYNNDGRLDLFLTASVYQNLGSLQFTPAASLGIGATRNGAAWGDYDRDGDLDIAVAGGGITRVFRNDNGNFVPLSFVFQGLSNGVVAWGDYDNDGKLDLLVSGDKGGGVPFTGLYHNDGNGNFTLVPSGLTAYTDSAASWGDFDNDGRLDLLLAGSAQALIWRNNGDGTFSPAANLAGLNHPSVAWGDFDKDGLLDALVSGSTLAAGCELHVYHNNGNGTFTDLALPLPGVASGEAQWADYDGDGYLDIFVGGCASAACTNSLARLYHNNHDGTFTDTDPGMTPVFGYSASWGDADGDGDLDVFLDRLYRNNSPVSNAPPTAPNGLVADLLPDNNVLLHWQVGGDGTNYGGLSYSLRIGTAPGGVDYLSPHAAPNGLRRLPERGLANGTNWFLRDVPRGTFYWSVQTIDVGLAGSPFSAQGTFTITNARPIISAVSNQFTVPGRPTPSLPFTVSDLETPAASLVVNAFSSNTNLVPSSGLVLGGSGSTRTIQLFPAAHQSGSSTITLTAADAAGLVATSRFDVVVQSFTDAQLGLPASSTGASAWGDYDSDGDLDIALAGGGVSFTSIFRNDGPTNFVNQNFSMPNRSGNHLAWVDYDRDGDLDLSEAGWSSTGGTSTTLVFRNNGNNTFTTVSLSTLTNLADGSISWVDYDNDGDADLFITGNPNISTLPGVGATLYRNDNGFFTDTKILFPAVSKSAAAWADIDNDGDLDLIMAGQTGSTAATAITKIFRNDGNGVFTEIPTTIPGVTQSAIALGDYDNDGRVDILIAGMDASSNRVAKIFHNDGNCVFSDSGAVLTGVSQASVAWGDYDNDGLVDAIVAGFGAVTKVYHNNGDGTFSDEHAALPSIVAHSISWGDYDGDGDLDLLLGSQVYRNNWNRPNTPPTAPTGLQAQLNLPNQVRLQWTASTDLQTTNSAGLNYNLRVGTTPGGSQMMSPQSDLVTGYHRVPQAGNAGYTNFWRVANLTNGTYYWSVQAIDPAFAASTFAAESSFTVSRPSISAITNRSMPPNSTLGPVGFTVGDAETAASNLIVTASSADTKLVPAAGLVLGGSDTNRTLSITPTHDRSGITTITIFATDENGETAATSFVLTVERFKAVSPSFPAIAGPIAWGDYDNDGFLDLLSRTALYHNSGFFVGLPQFVLATNISAPIEGSANWGDFDNDNDLDLLVTGSNASRILRNDGSNVFTLINASLIAPGSLGASAWGDFNNDGLPDLVIAGGNGTRIYRNNGNGTFSDANVTGLPSIANGGVAWGDFDRDGRLDLLLAGNNTFQILRNNGNGSFSILISFAGLYNASVACADFNNDGLLDFAVCGSTNGSLSGVVTRIYRCFTNASQVTFTNISNPSTGPVGVWNGAVAWGDYDNDGFPDLLVTGLSTNNFPLTRLYHNNGGTNFTDSGFSFPAMSSSYAAWGDFDNDGYLDLALSGLTNGSFGATYVLRNFGAAVAPSNSPPTAPLGLASAVTNKSVTLRWLGAMDPNQTNGFTYNLRVGTAPGFGNIVGPMSSAASGQRRIAALGNAGVRLSWPLTNLIAGTYYWSVQAIDHSFAASPFAAEQSFTITNRPPFVTDRFLTTAEDTPGSITLAAADPDNDPLTFSIVALPQFGDLSIGMPVVVYRPHTNYFGFDQFTYRVSDRSTNVDATVFVTVTPVTDVSDAQLGIAPLGGGGTTPPDRFQISLMAEPWKTWQIQASTDLVHWESLSNLLATNVLSVLIDTDAALYPHRFYRAAQITIQPSIVQFVKTNNTFSLTLTGELGRDYLLETSTNLTTWTPLQNILFTNSSMSFSEPNSSAYSQRFYRLRFMQ